MNTRQSKIEREREWESEVPESTVDRLFLGCFCLVDRWPNHYRAANRLFCDSGSCNGCRADCDSSGKFCSKHEARRAQFFQQCNIFQNVIVLNAVCVLYECNCFAIVYETAALAALVADASRLAVKHVPHLRHHTVVLCRPMSSLFLCQNQESFNPLGLFVLPSAGSYRSGHPRVHFWTLSDEWVVLGLIRGVPPI